MAKNNSMLFFLFFFLCFVGACRTKSPFIRKTVDYNYTFTSKDTACLKAFFYQDTSYLSFVKLNNIDLTEDSLVVQYNEERKCFYKDGFTIYKLSSYNNTYTKFYYTYQGEIRGIERIVNGEIVSKGIVDKDVIIIKVYQISDPFW
jgi:hypothetical protein